MKQIPREQIDEIRARNDIVDVIGSYITLKPAGSRFKAICPFHKEKTPSFTVSPDRQIYHCFGCDAGGDVINFVMEYEKVDFHVALQMLADRCGMDLQFEEGNNKGINKRELFRIHEEVALLYHKVLIEHTDGELGRSYLATRNLKPETVESFRLGFAPDRFDALERWAQKKKIPLETMELAGLMAKSEKGSVYDRFRKRLMFPILDEAGRVIGFSGRLIDKNDRGGKYVNSPETPLFRKSRVLFGIDKARRTIADKRTAIVVEGQLDAIRCHEAGITNVVASQGTALTSDHARIIRRYADEVVLVLDADVAGQKAALRSSEAFIAEELSVRVASLPAGEDPDSLILNRSLNVFTKCVLDAVSALDFLIDCSARVENLESEVGVMRTIRAAQSLIVCAPGAVQRDRMVQKACERLKVSPSAFRRDMVRKKRSSVPKAATLEQNKAQAKELPPPSEEVILAQLLAQNHNDVFPVVADHLPLEYISNADCRVLIDLLLESSDGLIERTPSDQPSIQKLAARIQMEDTKVRNEDGVSAERAAQDIVLGLWKKALVRQREQLRSTGQIEQSLAITAQLQFLKKGWEHAVAFMIA